MARRKSIKQSAHAHRCLHLESFEARLALSAAEGPTTDFQFNGLVLDRWLDQRILSDTVMLAPVTAGQLPPETIRSILTIVDSQQVRPEVVVNLEGVRNWLDRRAIQFNSFSVVPSVVLNSDAITNATVTHAVGVDGGYIDLTGQLDFGGVGDLGGSTEPAPDGLFNSPGTAPRSDELGSLHDISPSVPTPGSSAPTPGSAPTPTAQGPSGGQTSGEKAGAGGLEAWSSLGRPAVIATDGASGGLAGGAAGATNVKYARASEAGGWIALEPILAQSDLEEIEALRLASPETKEKEFGATKLDFRNDDAVAGEWARAAVFEMIGGDPTDAQPVGRAVPIRPVHLKQDGPSMSGGDEASPTLGATATPSQAAILLPGSGWLDDMAGWVKARTGAAIDDLFGSDEDDASGAVGGWSDYAGAGALLLAIAMERLAAEYREGRQNADTALSEKLRLRRAEITNRLSMRLKPMETR